MFVVKLEPLPKLDAIAREHAHAGHLPKPRAVTTRSSAISVVRYNSFPGFEPGNSYTALLALHCCCLRGHVCCLIHHTAYPLRYPGKAEVATPQFAAIKNSWEGSGGKRCFHCTYYLHPERVKEDVGPKVLSLCSGVPSEMHPSCSIQNYSSVVDGHFSSLHARGLDKNGEGMRWHLSFQFLECTIYC